MANTTACRGLVTGCVLLMAGVSPAWAVTVQEMLTIYKPDFADVQITTPTPDEYSSCEVKWFPGKEANTGSWILFDAKKQRLRCYSITNTKKIFDTWSYYKDGQEVFRELDTDFNGRKNQYRWLNSAGMKWGISNKEDRKIDAWQMISAEEVAQEVFAALANGDVTRLQALMITDADMRVMKLPSAETQRMTSLVTGAPAKFQAVRAKLPQLDGQARLISIESATPRCVLAEANGTDQDQLRYPYRTFLFEAADKKHDWVQTGAMIKVGKAWRLIDGPSLADNDAAPSAGGADNLALRKLYDQLTAIDAKAPPALRDPHVDKAVQDYNMSRVAVIKQIVSEVKADEQETWIKQIFDNLSAAHQAGSAEALSELVARQAAVAAKMPGSNLAAYGAYRQLWATYAAKLAGPQAAKTQDEWLDKLEKFAKAYPKAEDTPDALWQLASGSEAAGKDEEAKGWYRQIYQGFPSHPLSAKAKGSEARLNLIGRPLELAGAQLGTNAMFDVAGLKGKVVVVYYWASTISVCERDFVTLNRLRAAHAKDMEIVCVSLDDTAAAAGEFLRKNPLAGIQLYQAAKDGGGLNSPLAISYGINSLPTLFLIGKDGRVLDRTLQVGDLEAALRRAL